MSDALEKLAEIPEALHQFQDIEKPVEPEKADTEAKQPEERKVDPLEEKARAAGWRPKEEFDGDPDSWVDHGEFIRRKPLFDQIHQLKRELKSKAEQIDQVSSYAAKAAERARAELLKELEEQKREAFQNADYDAFNKADSEIKKVEAEAAPVVEVPKQPEVPPEMTDFLQRNDRWFDKDRAMTVFALAEAERLKAEGVPFGDMLKRVEQEVRKEFAHKFTNPNKEKPAAVVPDAGEKVVKGKLTYNDLTREERSVWASLKDKMSFDEFIKDLR